MPDLPHYWLKMLDGTIHHGMLGRDIRKTLDRRSDRDAPQVVYEVRNARGMWIRVWTDEIEGVTADVEMQR